MLGSTLTLAALLGLEAVMALPTEPAATEAEKRTPQTFVLPPITTIQPGDPGATCDAAFLPWLCIITGPIKPSNKRQTFVLPGGDPHDRHKKEAIREIEEKIIRLQNKKHKSDHDYEELDNLYAALEYLAGVTAISAPPGSGTILIPGKAKRQTIGKSTCSDANLKALIAAFAELFANASPSDWPYIAVAERYLAALLRSCGKSWTGPLIPDYPNEGGPIIADPTTPGSPITADPTNPGSPIKPSDKKARDFIAIGEPLVGGLVPDVPFRGGKIRPSD